MLSYQPRRMRLGSGCLPTSCLKIGAMLATALESTVGVSAQEFALELSPASICTAQPPTSLIHAWRAVSGLQFR